MGRNYFFEVAARANDSQCYKSFKDGELYIVHCTVGTKTSVGRSYNSNICAKWRAAKRFYTQWYANGQTDFSDSSDTGEATNKEGEEPSHTDRSDSSCSKEEEPREKGEEPLTI